MKKGTVLMVDDNLDMLLIGQRIFTKAGFEYLSARSGLEGLTEIEQVAALLKQDPSLQLAVNGHTDDSGDAAHNQQLSEGRAKSVVALLTAKGIDAARLTAAGFGSRQPVADNGTQEGKARNRRVELVKQ